LQIAGGSLPISRPLLKQQSFPVPDLLLSGKKLIAKGQNPGAAKNAAMGTCDRLTISILRPVLGIKWPMHREERKHES
jgi:hypothetical protein